jgi:hypothetical protein
MFRAFLTSSIADVRFAFQSLKRQAFPTAVSVYLALTDYRMPVRIADHTHRFFDAFRSFLFADYV